MARPASIRRKGVLTLQYGFLIVATLFSLAPFVFTLLTSFKRKIDILVPSRVIFPPTLANYETVFNQRDIMFYIGNSAAISTLTVIPSLILGLLAAYGLSRFRLTSGRSVAATLLSFRMIPAIAVVIPYFLVAQILGLVDTWFILILAYMTMNLPLAVWMLRGFIRAIPPELDEAAQVDGASTLKILWSIHLPVISPGLVATGILLFIQTWNEFAFAQFLTSTRARTFPTTAGFFLSITGTSFGEMAAVSIVGTLPVLILAFAFRRRLVSGLSYGAV